MFSRRLALAPCSGGWATVKMPMRLAAMSSAVTSARSSPVTRPALRISSMAASSSVWVWAWAISPDSIIASSVSSMPFLVAIQSPNSSIQRRSAAGGGGEPRDLIAVDRVDERLAGGEVPVERGNADPGFACDRAHGRFGAGRHEHAGRDFEELVAVA